MFIASGNLALARSPAPDPVPKQIEAELAAAQRTRDVLMDKAHARHADLRSRVRTLYKLTRGGIAPLWVDAGSRAELVRRRAAARRLILRDLEEWQLLRGELAAAEVACERLTIEAAAAAQAEPLPSLMLDPPVRGPKVAGFGAYKDEATGARVMRRGIELVAHRGETVSAPADGRVLYAGPVRGLGIVVLIDHGHDIVTVVGGLAQSPLLAGAQAARGAPIGDALGASLAFEVRRRGRPIDPARMLVRRSSP